MDPSQLIGLGALAALGASALGARRAGVPIARALMVASVAIIAGAGGARLMWALVWRARQGAWPALEVILDPRLGGASSLGLMLGAGLVCGLAAWRGARHAPALLDALAPAGVLGLGIARLGCDLAGCDFGRPATQAAWGMRHQAPSAAYDFYASQGLTQGAWTPALLPLGAILGGGAILIALLSMRVRPGRGARAWCAITGYVTWRLVGEWARAPGSVPTLGGVSMNQVAMGAALVILLAIGFRWREQVRG